MSQQQQDDLNAMKKLCFWGGAVGVLFWVTITFAACKALTPEAKTDLLLAKDVGCALANIFLGDAEIKDACQIADQKMPAILNLVSAQREKLKTERAAGVKEGALKAGCVNKTERDGGN